MNINVIYQPSLYRWEYGEFVCQHGATKEQKSLSISWNEYDQDTDEEYGWAVICLECKEVLEYDY